MNTYNIDDAIDNINLQNENLLKIINNGIILTPNIEYLSNIVPETQRLICFKRLISNLKNNAKKCNRSVDINITEKELNDIYLKQNGKCIFTKRDLTFNYIDKTQVKKYKSSLNTIKKIKEVNDFNVSINRIDNDEPYNYGNVQLIACRVNLMKNSLSNNNFIKLCGYVIKKNEN